MKPYDFIGVWGKGSSMHTLCSHCRSILHKKSPWSTNIDEWTCLNVASLNPSYTHPCMHIKKKIKRIYCTTHKLEQSESLMHVCLCVCVRPWLCYAPFPVSCADSLKPKGLYWYWPSSHGSQRTLYINPASSVLTVVLLWNVKIATLNLQNALRQFHIHAVVMMWSLIVSAWIFFVLRQISFSS